MRIQKVNTTCLFVLAAVAHFCTACKDEYSYEATAIRDSIVTPIIDSVLTAQFTFLGASDTCTAPILIGTYLPGSGLTPANAVTLQVHVTGVGTYAITTDTVDGFYFAATGRFASIGDQTVVMVGAGTPVASGTFHFKPENGGSFCSFPVRVEDTMPATYLLIADPSTRCVNQIIDGAYTPGVSLNASNHVTIVVDVKSTGVFTVQTNESNGMYFSYSGNFLKTGYQYVTLAGVGAPKNAGTYAFTPQIVGPHPLGGEACTFYVPVN